MKHLTDYIKEGQSEVLKKHGVFFAFSNEQFAEGKQEGTRYARIGAGMFCPVPNVEAFAQDYKRAILEGIEADKAKNGKEAIILRELCNHECFYTGDITDCIEAVEPYGYCESDVRLVYSTNYDTYSDYHTCERPDM